MFGWLKARRWAQSVEARPFQHLTPGRRYHVVQAFSDHDAVHHPVGETWTFLRSGFLPYEDGLSLFVATPEGSERHIRLQGRPEAEGPIVDHLHRYVVAVPDTTAPGR